MCSDHSSTYSSWLKSQPEVIQNDILGTKRAADFRNGSLTIDKFNGTQPLTLDQFKSKRGLITGKQAVPVKE